MFVYSILLQWALISPFWSFFLLSLSIIRVQLRFSWGHFTLWVTFVMFLECWGFMWEFYEIFHFLDHDWYVLWVWEMSGLLLGSLDHCHFHHSIIGDMTFLCCTDMGWSLSILLPLCQSMLSCHLFFYIDFFFYSFPTSIHISYLKPSSHYSHVSLIA